MRLVVGLNNSGDSLRNSPIMEDAIVNLLERLGVNVTGEPGTPPGSGPDGPLSRCCRLPGRATCRISSAPCAARRKQRPSTLHQETELDVLSRTNGPIPCCPMEWKNHCGTHI